MELLRQYSLIGLVIYFIVILFAVFRFNRNRSAEEYFLANRSLPFWALAVTFIASWWGAGSAVETADKAFEQGLSAFWIYGMPVLFSTFLMFLLAKGIRRIGTITQSQLLQERYSKTTSHILSVLIVLFMTITAASQMVGIGIFFESFLQIPYVTGVLLGTIIVIVYSFFGGFKGVVLTDMVQFVFLLIASVLVFGFAWYYSNGWESMTLVAAQKELDGFTSFTHGISGNAIYIITFGSAWMIQANVWQRISATRTPKDAQKMIGLSFLVYIPLYLMVTVTGMLAIGLFDKMPEGGVIPGIIQQFMHPALGAVMFVGICSAIMSTLDSLLNTGAMVLSVDLFPIFKKGQVSQKEVVVAGKLATLVIAAIGLLISIRIKSILEVSWIAADFLATGAFVPLTLGFIWKRGNHQGALASMIFGTCFSLYNLALSLGLKLPALWKVASTEQVLIGMCGSLIIYVVASLLTSQSDLGSRFVTKAMSKNS
ncbi:sodium:solute symporter family protein [Prolixibacteraceae bacterium JC049]|nr:sodium:solute symporter family protein [Prolixibacteraceae bacterium JC049]